MPIDPDLTRVVVSDVHGNYEALRCVLEGIGVIDHRGRRQEGFWIVQVGDLVNMTDSTRSGDIASIKLAEKVIDIILCGNHELWHAWKLKPGLFKGMVHPPEVEVTRAIRRLVKAGQLRPAAAVDNWLVSHAGVHRSYQQVLPPDAEGAVQELEDRFFHRLRTHMEDPVFDAIGRIRSKGVDRRVGGLFWLDAMELAISGSRLPQIIGHTPTSVREPVEVSRHLWTIDPGSHKVGAITKEGLDGDWTTYLAESREGETRLTSGESAAREQKEDGSGN